MRARVTRTRARRSDENNVPKVSTHTFVSKQKKPARTPLADRTNSASDENTSSDEAKTKLVKVEVPGRPRRAPRIPIRLANHEVTITPPRRKISSRKDTNVDLKEKPNAVSPFKAPNTVDSSVIVLRPRRVQRLPSRFEDTITASTYVALQPRCASTPMPSQEKDVSKTQVNRALSKKKDNRNNNNPPDNQMDSTPNKKPIEVSAKNSKEPVAKTLAIKVAPIKSIIKTKTPVEIIQTRPLAKKLESPKKENTRLFKTTTSSGLTIKTKTGSPKKGVTKEKLLSPIKETRRIFKNISPRKLLTEKIVSVTSPELLTLKKITPEIKKKMAIYEFTFDPKEEPKIPKKKIKKQTVRMKAAPRRVVIKDNYSKNIEKQLENLKSMLPKKKNGDPSTTSAMSTVPSTSHPLPLAGDASENNQISKKIKKNIPPRSLLQGNGSEPANGQSDQLDDHPLIYSPHHSPEDSHTVHNKDPQDIMEEFSFFDEVPVASSSMVSRKSIATSPWRFDCEVRRKYPVVYVKPDMTPAYESSLANIDVDVKTNRCDNSGLFIDQLEASDLKQTSILSFIKEKAEKKRHSSAVTPKKVNSVFYDSNFEASISEPLESLLPSETAKNTPNNSEDSAPINGIELASAESPFAESQKNFTFKNARNKENHGVNEFFGFDDSAVNEDQENISPKKRQKVLRSKRILQSRVGLSELNQQKPMRLTTLLPKAFAPTSAVVNKLYEELKSVIETPVEPDVENPGHVEVAKNLNSDESSIETSIEESVTPYDEEKNETPVPLFEDIEVVHHSKPERKSYGRTRKVTFHQTAVVTHDTDESDALDDVGDSTFTLVAAHTKRQRKRKKKNQVTDKEKEEAEAWAEKFNSMIEEAEGYALVID